MFSTQTSPFTHLLRGAWALAWLSAGCQEGEMGQTAPEPQVPLDAGAGDAADDGDGGASEPEATLTYVTVRFEARVGDEPFACDRTYRGVGTRDVEVAPRDLRVFVQDLALIRADDGTEVPLKLEEREGFQRSDVSLLDFENNAGSCVLAGGTAATNTVITGWVPAGRYDGVAFTNGVPESVNHLDPITLTAPLVAGPLHWSWQTGFLFFNAQLQSVSPEAPGSALVHIGSTLCSPNQGCGKPNRNRVVLADFDASTDRVVLDLAPLFQGTDLGATTACHAEGVDCSAFFGPLGIDYATGQPAKGQSLYHVE